MTSFDETFFIILVFVIVSLYFRYTEVSWREKNRKKIKEIENMCLEMEKRNKEMEEMLENEIRESRIKFNYMDGKDL